MATATTINRDRIKLRLASVKLGEHLAHALYAGNGELPREDDDIRQLASHALALYFKNPTPGQVDQLLTEFSG